MILDIRTQSFRSECSVVIQRLCSPARYFIIDHLHLHLKYNMAIKILVLGRNKLSKKDSFLQSLMPKAIIANTNKRCKKYDKKGIRVWECVGVSANILNISIQ